MLFRICNSYCMVQIKGIYIENTAKNVAKIEVTVKNYEGSSLILSTQITLRRNITHCR